MGVDAHLAIFKSRSRWNYSSVPRTQTSVLRGLGQRLNKQKPLISTFAEMRGFRLWRAIGIACHYYTKFGLIVDIPTFVLYRLFKKGPQRNSFGQKSRYNILLFQWEGTRGFARVGITNGILRQTVKTLQSIIIESIGSALDCVNLTDSGGRFLNRFLYISF